MDSKTTLPREVDFNLIREMRQSGLGYEARQLLNAYYKEKKQTKEQMRKEIRRINTLKRKFKKMEKKDNLQEIKDITFAQVKQQTQKTIQVPRTADELQKLIDGV